MKNLLHLSSSMRFTMQHLPFHLNMFFFQASKPRSKHISAYMQCLQCNISLYFLILSGQSEDVVSFSMEMEDQVQWHLTPPSPTKEGLRGKEKESGTAHLAIDQHQNCSLSLETFLQVINMSNPKVILLFLYLWHKSLLQQHSEVNYFQEVPWV